MALDLLLNSQNIPRNSRAPSTNQWNPRRVPSTMVARQPPISILVINRNWRRIAFGPRSPWFVSWARNLGVLYFCGSAPCIQNDCCKKERKERLRQRRETFYQVILLLHIIQCNMRHGIIYIFDDITNIHGRAITGHITCERDRPDVYELTNEQRAVQRAARQPISTTSTTRNPVTLFFFRASTIVIFQIASTSPEPVSRTHICCD